MSEKLNEKQRIWLFKRLRELWNKYQFCDTDEKAMAWHDELIKIYEDSKRNEAVKNILVGYFNFIEVLEQNCKGDGESENDSTST